MESLKCTFCKVFFAQDERGLNVHRAHCNRKQSTQDLFLPVFEESQPECMPVGSESQPDEPMQLESDTPPVELGVSDEENTDDDPPAGRLCDQFAPTENPNFDNTVDVSDQYTDDFSPGCYSPEEDGDSDDDVPHGIYDADWDDESESDEPPPEFEPIASCRPPSPRYKTRSQIAQQNREDNETTQDSAHVDTDDNESEFDGNMHPDEDPPPESVNSESLKKILEELDVSAREALENHDAASVELLYLLKQANCSLGVYDSVLKWVKSHNPDDLAGMSGRESMTKKLIKRYNYDHLRPIDVKCYLPGAGTTVTLTTHDFIACLHSLLTNEELMKRDNLLFDPANPTAKPQHGEELGDINTGSAYVDGWAKYCTDDGRDVMIPIIFFIDGTYVDSLGKHTLEPVCFTLGCFNYETRCKPEAWRTLGFIKKTPVRVWTPKWTRSTGRPPTLFENRERRTTKRHTPNMCHRMYHRTW